MKKKEEPDSWIVKVKATVHRTLVVSGCTKEQAAINPYAFEVEEETEDYVLDQQVLSVEPCRGFPESTCGAKPIEGEDTYRSNLPSYRGSIAIVRDNSKNTRRGSCDWPTKASRSFRCYRSRN